MLIPKILYLFPLQIVLAIDLADAWTFEEYPEEESIPIVMKQIGPFVVPIVQNKNISSRSMIVDAEKKDRRHLILKFLKAPSEASRQTVLDMSRKYYEKNFNCTKQQTDCTRKDEEGEFEDRVNVAELMHEFEKATELYRKVHIHTNETNKRHSKTRRLSDVTSLIESLRELIEAQRSFLDTLNSSTAEVDPMMQEMRIELNLTEWHNDVRRKCSWLRFLEDIEFRLYLHEYLQPLIQSIILVVGLVGNVLLLIILFKHRFEDSSPNILLLNLTLVDFFNILICFPLFYMHFVSVSQHMGEVLCKLYRFFLQLGIGLSVYSVVAISVHRYVMLYSYKEKTFLRRLKIATTMFIASSVWIIGVLISLPYGVNAAMYGNKCDRFSRNLHINYLAGMAVVGFVIICVVPACVIGISCVLSCAMLKYTPETKLEKVLGATKRASSSVVSLSVLIALVAVSAICYIPFHTFAFYAEWVDGEVKSRSHYLLSFITYLLAYGNFCLNPIVILILNKQFRSGKY